MTPATRDKWRQICAELGFPHDAGASFEQVMKEIKRLKGVAHREVVLREAARGFVRLAHYADRGKVRCMWCKGDYYGKHAPFCEIDRLKGLVGE